MTGAMYAAINGLKSHMSKLNVIGNNIANVNTYGYKTQRMVFQESMYATSRSGSNGVIDQSGGITPSQIGYGATVGAIDINMSSSTFAPSGVQMDAFIDGEGFFMVGSPDLTIRSSEDFSRLNLTRVGDFNADPNGYIVDHYGNVVYGFATVQNPDYIPEPTEDQIAATKDPTNDLYGKDITHKTIVSTELVPLRLPLSAVAPTGGQDGNGGAEVDNNGVVTKTYWTEGDAVYPVLGGAATDTSHTNVAADTENLPKLDWENENEVALGYGKTMSIPNSDNKCVQLESMSIGADGCISGINKATKETVVVGYIAIASPDCSEGLTHIGGPYYSAMGGSGDLRVAVFKGLMSGKYINNPESSANVNDAILSGGEGEIKNGGLEASSTDVATEFSEMITTQRGYQANTRIVTVTDSMLEELVNMKR